MQRSLAFPFLAAHFLGKFVTRHGPPMAGGATFTAEKAVRTGVHLVAVVVQEFKERSEDMTYISANIFVERDTQKAIILGRRGEMIKRIGRDARREIEELLDSRVYLELWVKVRKRWRKDEKELQRLGYGAPR